MPTITVRLLKRSATIAAGNDTTRYSLTEGLRALVDHPDQFRALRDDPSLIDTAVEEILRWTSPIIHFARTATRDVEVRGQKIAEGEIEVRSQ